MQFVHQPVVNARHSGSMYLPGMTAGAVVTGPVGRINYTIRQRRGDDHGHSVRFEDISDDVHSPTKSVPVPNALSKSLQEEIMTARKKESNRSMISYQVVPGGPWRTFKAPKSTSRKNNAAATTIQRLVRGHCARTNTYVRRLEHKLATIQRRTKSELCAIDESKKQAMLQMRRQMIKQEARTLKAQMACAETANQGVLLIQHLRRENKKLREKNDKIARAIAELRHQNERLEKAATMTVSNESLLSNHYDHIQATHQALQVVVPQFQKKIKDMTDAVDIRRQYWTTERKMKILYVQLVGSLVEMLEDQCDNQELVDSVVAMCVELKGALPENVTTEEVQGEQEEEEVLEEKSDSEDNSDDDSSDSNDYDEYDIAGFTE